MLINIIVDHRKQLSPLNMIVEFNSDHQLKKIDKHILIVSL